MRRIPSKQKYRNEAIPETHAGYALRKSIELEEVIPCTCTARPISINENQTVGCPQEC